MNTNQLLGFDFKRRIQPGTICLTESLITEDADWPESMLILVNRRTLAWRLNSIRVAMDLLSQQSLNF
nr:hypothetical protein HmN_000926200 [Hymenolepis microstoma]